MLKTERITEAILCKAIEWISLPVWLFSSIWHNKAFKGGIFTFAIISGGIVYFFGFDAYAAVMTQIMRFLMAMGFMVLQFIGLFWFLSKTKVIETTPGEEGAITFDDYYGSQYLVKLVRQWVSLLTNRNRLDDMGGKAISGILLIGVPGVGKSMLAQALSSDSQAAFIGMSGSDFTAMFMGVGVLKVRGMFAKARKWARIYGACILFIDEIDSIAGNRGGVQGDQPVQGGMAGGMFGGMGGLGVMSRLLVEMDGITEIPVRDRIQNSMRAWLGIKPIDPGTLLLMAATNRVGVLDPAILRPGRFDKKIDVSLPDKASRRSLFNGYLSKIKHKEIDIEALVSITAGVSQAFIASAICKDSVRIAIFDGRDKVSQRDIEDALQEILLGIPQPISELEPEQKHQIAVHESGHTVAVHQLLSREKRIARVSIVRRSGALGYMLPVEVTDRYTVPLSRFTKDIMVSLAGHVACEVVLGEAWTGASGDLNNVRARVWALHSHGAFGEVPLLNTNEYSKDITKRVNKFIRDCMDETRELLIKHRLSLDALIEGLLEKEDLSGNEAVAIMEAHNESE